jgi:hypothetical protein
MFATQVDIIFQVVLAACSHRYMYDTIHLSDVLQLFVLNCIRVVVITKSKFRSGNSNNTMAKTIKANAGTKPTSPSGGARDSPKKAKAPQSMREKLKQKKEKPVPTIRAFGFIDNLAVEAYEYVLTDTKQGFIHKYRLWAKGDLEVDALTEANFIGLKEQRDNDDEGNETRKDSDGYAKIWLIRYPPENESTKATRREGLRVLKNFFMSKTASLYPPNEIKTVDATTDIPCVLDTFFLDSDIEEIVKTFIHEDELNDGFYAKFTTLAQAIYLEKEPSVFAQLTLGFPMSD